MGDAIHTAHGVDSSGQRLGAWEKTLLTVLVISERHDLGQKPAIFDPMLISPDWLMKKGKNDRPAKQRIPV